MLYDHHHSNGAERIHKNHINVSGTRGPRILHSVAHAPRFDSYAYCVARIVYLRICINKTGGVLLCVCCFLRSHSLAKCHIRFLCVRDVAEAYNMYDILFARALA